MRYLHVLALATLIGCPALVLAQAKDATQSYDRARPGSSNIRNFTLRNTAANAIADARVRLSDDSTRVLTETGPITKSHSQTFAAPNKACLTEVKVQFEGGRTLEAKGIDDCTAQTIVVEDGRILAQGSPTAGPPAPVQVSPAD
jgi:hypothetical protein